ncbi:helix-turn-helix domain-containing protein [Pseudovibrio brasiliensis]|uniref:Helix-turn-helix domain-containing protein n=1 Tax=Pseudovibrio brasiliensis TaxID=1898042 RepID=A0ABX8ANZ5_9HYPH|nr:helix-turn-helix domain-containing protein [Pseudovibrio brasiliensis]
MCSYATRAVYDSDFDLSGPENSVLAYLAFRANPEEGDYTAPLECWPSISTICKATKLGRSTVDRALRSLEQKGFIESQARYSNRRRTSSMYTLLFFDADDRAEAMRDRNQNRGFSY